MSNSIRSALIFVVGALVGSAATWKFVKDKYEKQANEEIDSIIERYTDKEAKRILGNHKSKASTEPAPDETPKKELKPDMVEYQKKLQHNDYVDYGSVSPIVKKEVKEEKKEEPKSDNGIEVIPYEKYLDIEDYDDITLTYYADEVLADEDDGVIKDVEDIVGLDSLETFGQYEEDAVFVRNDRYRCYYEILKDDRRYEDVVGETLR